MASHPGVPPAADERPHRVREERDVADAERGVQEVPRQTVYTTLMER